MYFELFTPSVVSRELLKNSVPVQILRIRNQNLVYASDPDMEHLEMVRMLEQSRANVASASQITWNNTERELFYSRRGESLGNEYKPTLSDEQLTLSFLYTILQASKLSIAHLEILGNLNST